MHTHSHIDPVRGASSTTAGNKSVSAEEFLGGLYFGDKPLKEDQTKYPEQRENKKQDEPLRAFPRKSRAGDILNGLGITFNDSTGDADVVQQDSRSAEALKFFENAIDIDDETVSQIREPSHARDEHHAASSTSEGCEIDLKHEYASSAQFPILEGVEKEDEDDEQKEEQEEEDLVPYPGSIEERRETREQETSRAEKIAKLERLRELMERKKKKHHVQKADLADGQSKDPETYLLNSFVACPELRVNFLIEKEALPMDIEQTGATPYDIMQMWEIRWQIRYASRLKFVAIPDRRVLNPREDSVPTHPAIVKLEGLGSILSAVAGVLRQHAGTVVPPKPKMQARGRRRTAAPFKEHRLGTRSKQEEPELESQSDKKTEVREELVD